MRFLTALVCGFKLAFLIPARWVVTFWDPKSAPFSLFTALRYTRYTSRSSMVLAARKFTFQGKKYTAIVWEEASMILPDGTLAYRRQIRTFDGRLYWGMDVDGLHLLNFSAIKSEQQDALQLMRILPVTGFTVYGAESKVRKKAHSFVNAGTADFSATPPQFLPDNTQGNRITAEFVCWAYPLRPSESKLIAEQNDFLLKPAVYVEANFKSLLADEIQPADHHRAIWVATQEGAEFADHELLKMLKHDFVTTSGVLKSLTTSKIEALDYTTQLYIYSFFVPWLCQNFWGEEQVFTDTFTSILKPLVKSGNNMTLLDVREFVSSSLG